MIKKNVNEITDYEINFCDADWMERHDKKENIPDKIKLAWSNWDELVDFFIGYFNHFGDDTSTISRDQLKRMIKTIYRFGNNHGFSEGMKYQKEITPTFLEELKEWKKSVEVHNNENEIYHEHVTFNELMSRI